MLRTAMQKPWYLAIALAIGMLCSVAALAAKPVKPPPEPPPYMLVDLLGFPGEGCQSGASFITDRDTSGSVLIGGGSNFFYTDGSWDGYPALWHVAVNGTFPETDPVSLGAAPDGTGREGKGLSRWCSGVMVTGTFQCFEQYEDGTWVVPSHVAFPDGEHIELPGVGPHHRNTYASGINDLGQIVGTYDAPNPDAPGEMIGFGGMWQLHPDGTITGPTSLGNTWTGGFAPSAINNFGVMAGGYMGWPAIAWFGEDGTLTIMQLDSSLRFWGADVNSLNDCPINDPALTVVGTSHRDADGNPTFGLNGYAWKPFGRRQFPGVAANFWRPGRHRPRRCQHARRDRRLVRDDKAR